MGPSSKWRTGIREKLWVYTASLRRPGSSWTPSFCRVVDFITLPFHIQRQPFVFLQVSIDTLEHGVSHGCHRRIETVEQTLGHPSGSRGTSHRELAGFGLCHGGERLLGGCPPQPLPRGLVGQGPGLSIVYEAVVDGQLPKVGHQDISGSGAVGKEDDGGVGVDVQLDSRTSGGLVCHLYTQIKLLFAKY